MIDEIKASDLLIEIKSEVSDIKKYLQNIDNNYKLILSKLNTICSNGSVQSKIDVAMPAPQPTVESFVEETKEETKKSIAKKYIKQTDKKIPLRQKVLYPDGKNVCMARVEIFDLTGKLIESCRTNQVGEWKVPGLSPGVYKIHLQKSATSDKPIVDVNQQFEVPSVDGVHQLENIQL